MFVFCTQNKPRTRRKKKVDGIREKTQEKNVATNNPHKTQIISSLVFLRENGFVRENGFF